LKNSEMAFSAPDINKLAILAATLSGAAIPVSTAGQNIGAALLLLVFLLSITELAEV
jgi:hypothetical protein